jgi:hypothetical protein
MDGVSTHNAMPWGRRQLIRPLAWAIADPHTSQGRANIAAVIATSRQVFAVRAGIVVSSWVFRLLELVVVVPAVAMVVPVSV